MSTPTKARSKRALPTVPLDRDRGVNADRIVTGTPKSACTISKKLDVEPARVDVIKNRNCVSQQQLQKRTDTKTNSKLRSELCSRTKDLSSSESGSNTSSPFGSPRETRKATVAPMVAKIIDKFSGGSQGTTPLGRLDSKEESLSTEKKIARVLPMTPQFLEEHIADPANEHLCTKNDVDSKANLKITDLQSTVEVNKDIDEVKGSIAPARNKNVLDVFQAKEVGTPSVTTTPQQPLVDSEGSSVRVGVRVRPFLPRYKCVFICV